MRPSCSPAGLDAARSTADWFTVLVSLYDLALSSQARGDLDGAAELLREGLSLAAEAGDEPSAAYYLEALATIARLRDDPDRAASLLAAADAQLQTSGSGWLHAYVPRAPHDHTILAELRSRLGDAAYEQAAADGRSLAGTRALRIRAGGCAARPRAAENRRLAERRGAAAPLPASRRAGYCPAHLPGCGIIAGMDLLADLEARGLVQDSTDREALRARIKAGGLGLYYGCDPSADSLQVGNLIGLLVLRRFADAGHNRWPWPAARPA